MATAWLREGPPSKRSAARPTTPSSRRELAAVGERRVSDARWARRTTVPYERNGRHEERCRLGCLTARNGTRKDDGRHRGSGDRSARQRLDIDLATWSGARAWRRARERGRIGEQRGAGTLDVEHELPGCRRLIRGHTVRRDVAPRRCCGCRCALRVPTGVDGR